MKTILALILTSCTALVFVACAPSSDNSVALQAPPEAPLPPAATPAPTAPHANGDQPSTDGTTVAHPPYGTGSDPTGYGGNGSGNGAGNTGTSDQDRNHGTVTGGDSGNGNSSNNDEPSSYAQTVHFDFGHAELNLDARTGLDQAIRSMKGHVARARIEITGYADRIESYGSTVTLASHRASAVREYMIRRSRQLLGSSLSQRAFKLAIKGQADPANCSGIECLGPDDSSTAVVEVSF